MYIYETFLYKLSFQRKILSSFSCCVISSKTGEKAPSPLNIYISRYIYRYIYKYQYVYSPAPRNLAS